MVYIEMVSLYLITVIDYFRLIPYNILNSWEAKTDTETV